MKAKNIVVSALSALTLAACQVNVTTQQDTAYYQEKYRPQYHFTPETSWMNDPNGMVYLDGEYHLFYQYYPDSNVWGPMHWGHAVTKDLVNWEHLPTALYPDSLGLIFSGSAVIDHKNTSGLGKGDTAPMIAIYTIHSLEKEKAGIVEDETQGIAYSLDKGRTWTKYANNPVLKNPGGYPDFRDPKVMWHDKTQKWVMSLAVGNHIEFYSSANLIDWKKESEFGIDLGVHEGVWECPDLIELPVEGTDEKRWVLLVSINPGGPSGGSATQYFVGDFDGSTFKADLKGFPKNTDKFIPKGDIIASFDTSFENWNVEGNAFGVKPTQGSIEGQHEVKGFEGNGVVNSFHNGDVSTGKLTSPTFKIKKPYLNFLIGGGAHQNKTCLNLLIDGKVVASKTGNNSENLEWKYWNVSDYVGKEAQLEIVDVHKEGWGHILVDHIFQADEICRPARDGALWLDYGKDNYAGVTWSNVPEQDGRAIIISWMSNWEYANAVPTDNWRSAMTVPRTLHLVNTEEGIRLANRPVRELDALVKTTSDISAKEAIQGIELKDKGQFEIQTTLDLSNANQAGFRFENGKGEFVKIYVDKATKGLYMDRSNAGDTSFSSTFAAETFAPLYGFEKDQKVTLRIFVDKSSIEVFTVDGLSVLTNLVFPTEDYSKLKLYSRGGEVKVEQLELKVLSSVWEK